MHLLIFYFHMADNIMGGIEVSSGGNTKTDKLRFIQKEKAIKAYDHGFGSPLTCDMDSTL